jgi:hypothetical protein
MNALTLTLASKRVASSAEDRKVENAEETLLSIATIRTVFKELSIRIIVLWNKLLCRGSCTTLRKDQRVYHTCRIAARNNIIHNVYQRASHDLRRAEW